MAEPGDVKGADPADWLTATGLDGKVTSQQELPGPAGRGGKMSASKTEAYGRDRGSAMKECFGVFGLRLRSANV